MPTRLPTIFFEGGNIGSYVFVAERTFLKAILSITAHFFILVTRFCPDVVRYIAAVSNFLGFTPSVDVAVDFLKKPVH
jgi:hypothetical protein